MSLFLFALGAGLPAQAPTPSPAAAAPALFGLPDGAFRTRMAGFAAAVPPMPATAPSKDELLRPELAFVPRRRWLVLPALAKELGADDEQQKVVRELLDAGAKELRTALAAEGADQDLGAIAALCVQQLWQFARDQEIEAAALDAMHAQLVQWLAVPELAASSDADKQRCWEVCAGYPIFLAAMLEAVEDDAQRSALRKVAAAAFEALLGVPPERVQIGSRGFVVRPLRGKLPAAAPKAAPAPKASPVATAGAFAPGASPLPTSGPAIDGVVWTDPAGWQRESNGGNVVFRATLADVDDQGRPEAGDESSHQAAIGFLPVQAATEGPTALFDRLWREQFAGFELGDTFVHYRGRLPGQLVVLYMGRFFERPNTPKTHGNPKTYGALWLVDLGGNRFQPVVAVVEPRDPGIGMDVFKESAALKALSFPLGAVLDSIRPKSGKPPYPAGGYFAAQDLRGAWKESSSAYGGSYYNSVTGGFAGVAVSSSGGHFTLRDDGSYDYAFAYSSSHPQFGNSVGSTKHDGRYRLDGDVVLIEPKQKLNYQFTCCAVGIGSRQTKAGVQRILVTVSAHSDGGFRQVPLIANWDQYQGVLTFYSEGD
ncbi:MAG: hypothetical protein MUC36_11265 [Planctomycetes bacterium]|nr:hypothetical protein [Planctomycetota bacterium]